MIYFILLRRPRPEGGWAENNATLDVKKRIRTQEAYKAMEKQLIQSLEKSTNETGWYIVSINLL